MTVDEPTKLYLGYLDKEMTIMGILASFCVAVVALTLDKILGAKSSEDTIMTNIWKNGECFVLIASAMMLLAAYCFYRQRARLSWHYGQISLCLAGVLKDMNEMDVQNWLKRADSWKTWCYYYTAFSFMRVAFLYYAAAIFSVSSAYNSNWVSKHFYIILIPTIWVFVCWLVRYHVFENYKFKDKPYKEFCAKDTPIKDCFLWWCKKLETFRKDYFFWAR